VGATLFISFVVFNVSVRRGKSFENNRSIHYTIMELETHLPAEVPVTPGSQDPVIEAESHNVAKLMLVKERYRNREFGLVGNEVSIGGLATFVMGCFNSKPTGSKQDDEVETRLWRNISCLLTFFVHRTICVCLSTLFVYDNDPSDELALAAESEPQFLRSLQEKSWRFAKQTLADIYGAVNVKSWEASGARNHAMQYFNSVAREPCIVSELQRLSDDDFSEVFHAKYKRLDILVQAALTLVLYVRADNMFAAYASLRSLSQFVAEIATPAVEGLYVKSGNRPRFDACCPEKQRILHLTSNMMRITNTFVTKEERKGRLMEIASRLVESINYATGGGNSVEAHRREVLCAYVTGKVPAHRQPKTPPASARKPGAHTNGTISPMTLGTFAQLSIHPGSPGAGCYAPQGYPVGASHISPIGLTSSRKKYSRKSSFRSTPSSTPFSSPPAALAVEQFVTPTTESNTTGYSTSYTGGSTGSLGTDCDEYSRLDFDAAEALDFAADGYFTGLGSASSHDVTDIEDGILALNIPRSQTDKSLCSSNSNNSSFISVSRDSPRPRAASVASLASIESSKRSYSTTQSFDDSFADFYDEDDNRETKRANIPDVQMEDVDLPVRQSCLSPVPNAERETSTPHSFSDCAPELAKSGDSDVAEWSRLAGCNGDIAMNPFISSQCQSSSVLVATAVSAADSLSACAELDLRLPMRFASST
jgi:hypothetical protein